MNKKELPSRVPQVGNQAKKLWFHCTGTSHTNKSFSEFQSGKKEWTSATNNTEGSAMHESGKNMGYAAQELAVY